MKSRGQSKEGGKRERKENKEIRKKKKEKRGKKWCDTHGILLPDWHC